MQEDADASIESNGSAPPGFEPPVEPLREENGLRLKLLQLRERNQSSVQRLSFLSETLTPDRDEEKEREASTQIQEDELPTLGSISERTNQLLANDEIGNTEFIVQGAGIVKDVRLLGRHLNAQAGELRNDHYHKKGALFRVESELESLDRVRGLGKMKVPFKRRQLSREKAQLEQELVDLETRHEVVHQNLTNLYPMQDAIEQRGAAVIIAETSDVVSEMTLGYREFVDEVSHDPRLTKEFSEKYIKDVVEPKIKEIAEYKKIDPEQQDGFYSALRTFLGVKDDPNVEDGEKERMLGVLNEMIYGGGFSDIQDVCRPLIGSGKEGAVAFIVASLAADDISSAKNAVGTLPGYESHWKFDRAVHDAIHSKAIEGLDVQDRFAFRQVTYFEQQIVDGVRSNRNVEIPNLDLWTSLTSSSRALEVFGDLLGEADQKIQERILDKSLEDVDGGFIDKLVYYPTPDSIRNLVLLASADYKNYRTIHANWALNRLAKRDDWESLLVEAEEQYPRLAKMRPVLLSWDYSDYGSNPDIKDHSIALAKDILTRDYGNKRLTALAIESLPNNSLVDFLTQRNILSEDQARILREADVLISTASERGYAQIRSSIEDGDQTQDIAPVVDSYHFSTNLRNILIEAMQVSEVDEDQRATIDKYLLLSQKCLTFRDDPYALVYLTSDSVVKKLVDRKMAVSDATILLTAYEVCPSLKNDGDLRREFCGQFKDRLTAVRFNELAVVYQDEAIRHKLVDIAHLIGRGSLTHERALELPADAKDILVSDLYFFAQEFAEVVLSTHEGTQFLRAFLHSGLNNLDKTLNVQMGKVGFDLDKSNQGRFFALSMGLLQREVRKLDEQDATQLSLTENNWNSLFLAYITLDVGDVPKMSEPVANKLREIFESSEAKDFVLDKLKKSWNVYLDGDPQDIPFDLFLTSHVIERNGAGTLSQVEAMNAFIYEYNLARKRKTTAPRTQLEIFERTRDVERRFTRDRWSNEDKAQYYNVSKDILRASPSLFADFSEVFTALKPSELKRFTEDIYPFYRAKLSLIEQRSPSGNIEFNPRELVEFRNNIRAFAREKEFTPQVFEKHHEQLVVDITSLFKEKFGVTKLPETLSPDHIRSLTNTTLYLSNMSERDAEKETILGFYLSLQMNGQWDTFRRGEPVNPAEFLTPEKAEVIQQIIDSQKTLNPLTAENLGILESDMPDFMKLLQQESQSFVVGDIETIDVKLANVMTNLSSLVDLDLYPDALDKARMTLLLQYGNKLIGSTAAKMYQSLSGGSRTVEFSEKEQEIRQEIERVVESNELGLTQATIKQYFQEGIRPLATVTNLLQFTKDARVVDEIADLHEKLVPPEDVVAVFKRLGEDFKPTSGAMALTHDLEYLDTLVVKREDELTPTEKTLVSQYIGEIRGQVVKLQEMYDQIKNKYGTLRQGAHTQNELLRTRLEEIGIIINAESRQQAITSIQTNDMNMIIENIRECLSCTVQGANNDTNLTFGDPNKFYLYSKSEFGKKGSISDQIVFIEPVKYEDGRQELSFVLDRLYGMATPNVFLNQVDTVVKKYRSLKERFPDAKLSLFITNASITTGGMSPDLVTARLKENYGGLTVREANGTVNVLPSAMGDHYVEFGGSSRAVGERSVSGVLLTL